MRSVSWNDIVSDEAGALTARTIERAEEMFAQGMKAKDVAKALPCSLETAYDIGSRMRGRVYNAAYRQRQLHA